MQKIKNFYSKLILSFFYSYSLSYFLSFFLSFVSVFFQLWNFSKSRSFTLAFIKNSPNYLGKFGAGVVLRLFSVLCFYFYFSVECKEEEISRLLPAAVVIPSFSFLIHERFRGKIGDSQGH
jgi:hypothetical protein